MFKVTLKGCFVIVLCLAILNTGAVRKKANYVLKTQTDPITLKQKLQEMEEGVKGAPTPSMEFYGKQKFLVDPPVEDPNAYSDTANLKSESTYGEPLGDDLRYESDETGTWWDEVYEGEEVAEESEIWGEEEEEVNWWSDDE